jgi:hypothetical protein
MALMWFKGTRRALESVRGTVQNITILDGVITAKGGTGVGTGAGFSSTVNQLEIQGGEVRTESVLGASIGSGSTSGNGQQLRVDTMQVMGKNVTARSQSGSERARPAGWGIHFAAPSRRSRPA